MDARNISIASERRVLAEQALPDVIAISANATEFERKRTTLSA